MTDPNPPDATLPVAVVARRLGVAPTTLRTWDRRYGLGPTTRARGAHRRYSPGDMARLEAMRRLIVTGVPPAEAARVTLAHDDPTGLGDRVTLDEGVRYAGTGGRVLSMQRATSHTRGLARAAMSLDVDVMTETLTSALAENGVVGTWDDLLRPLLLSIGERWQHTGEGVEVEHLLTECASVAMHRVPTQPIGVPARPVLLACVPNDTHALPLLVLSAALGEQGISARLLGAATPTEAIISAVRRTGPAALVLWSQTGTAADVSLFPAVPRQRPPTVLVAGGSGWPEALPPHVMFATSLRHALELVTGAVRG